MNLFATSDLHLSLNTDKSMEIFKGWQDYTQRIKNNWTRLVTDDDTVVVAGDISWGSSLEESKKDLEFLNSLPGKKLLIKGNHDFWWSTASKINSFFKENGFDTLNIVHNNCAEVGEYAVCGTRGWLYDGTGTHNKKVTDRECGRLKSSLLEAKDKNLKPIVFLHYPPAYGEFRSEEIIEILKEFNIKEIYYGHIHGAGFNSCLKECEGINFRLLSCDCNDFTPILVKKLKI